jgi:hypothetical protein
MPDGLRIFLTVIVSLLLGIVGSILLFGVSGVTGMMPAVWIGLIFGLLYGLEAGVLLIYDLNSPLGWLLIIVDLTWSLPNTVFGFVLGNLIYPWIAGLPSQSMSKDQGWICFNGTFGSSGNAVLQTLGNVNLGGQGQHEKMHLLQARCFGPTYLAIFGANYAVNFLIQCLFTLIIGLAMWKSGKRTTPYLTPPPVSAVGGFWGWIYHSNLFELWAYAVGNP